MASALGLVVILALGQLDVTRILLAKEVHAKAGSQGEMGLALAYMAKSLQQADRINLLSAGSAQFRTPVNRDQLDTGSGYTWSQYLWDSGAKEIRFYDPAGPCTLALTFRDIGSLFISYDNQSPKPPGSEPPVQDNNLLKLGISSTGTPPVTYWENVTIRAGAYTNLSATALGDSGTGLAPPGVSDPPPACS